MKLFSSVSEIVTAFLNGESEGKFENFYFNDGRLFKGGDAVAMRAATGEVVLANKLNNQADFALNDCLIMDIAKNNREFIRVNSFRELLDGEKIFQSAAEGSKEKLSIATKIYGFDDKAIDFTLFDIKANIKKEFEDKLAAIDEKINSTKETVVSFFKTKREELAGAKREAEFKALSSERKIATEAWDRGEALISSQVGLVQGAGGGTRLRVYGRNKDRVYGTTGSYTTLRIIKQAFNLFAPYLWGGKELTASQKNNLDYSSGAHIGYVRDYDMRLRHTNDSKVIVTMGCQSVTKEELERFANLQDWPLDGTTVPL